VQSNRQVDPAVIIRLAPRHPAVGVEPRQQVAAMRFDRKLRLGVVVDQGWKNATGRGIFERLDELRAFVGGFLVTTVEREGRLGGSGGEVVGFVPVEMPLAPSTGPNGALPGTGSFAAEALIEISMAGGRCLKVSASLPSAELRRLIRVVEGA
jgi:hypothetical protein